MSETTRTRVGGAYEVLAELGRGGMAEVLKARHKRLGRIVALKVLPLHLLADGEARARFEREARAGARLEHDHIVTTYDFGVYDGRPYLAVAFIEGETLDRRLRRQGRLSPAETVRLIAPIAEALDYAHRQGVIHRDVKSSNIMIRAEDERPILIDFGIAQASFAQKLTRRGDAMGTPEYMSPEQARAQEIDHRSDLYSLGVVLYECLTGTVPFQSANAEVVLANIKYEPHRPVRERVPEAPPWLSDVVDRCLAKQPDDRFQDGEALAAALRAGPDTAPEDVPPPLRPPARQRPARPSGRWAEYLAGSGAVLALLLLLGVLGYLLGWFGGPPPTPPEPEEPLADLVARAVLAYDAGQYPEALPLFLAAAGRGAAEAPYHLGEMFRKGEGVPSSNQAAARWYRRAADAGHAKAQSRLGRMYDLGEGVRRNDARAADWYRKAAGQGEAGAQNNLGLLYASGRGVAKDDQLAVAWYRKAAGQGLAVAQTNLAWMSENGRGVAQSDAEAIRWYARAAEQGDARAKKALERLRVSN